MTEKTRKPCKRGVYIDVFPLDGVGETLEEAREAFKVFDRKNMLLMTRTCVIRQDRSWYKNLSIIAARTIPNFIVNDKKLSISVDKAAERINRDGSKYVANLMGAYRAKEITLRAYFGKPTLYRFEGIMINGPERSDEYLQGLYKNWRELPPEEKRYTKHDFVEFNLEKPYME